MKRNICKVVISFVLLILVYIIYNIISICTYSTIDERRKADVIIVLGAAVYESDVSPVYRERLNHSIQLYQMKFADKIIVTGGVSNGAEKSDASVAKEYLIQKGISKENILTEDNSTITQKNLEYSKKIMEESGMKTAIIVSDPLHMKRAMILAEDAGIEAYSSPTETTMYRSMNTKLPFVAREVFFYIGYKWYRIFR